MNNLSLKSRFMYYCGILIASLGGEVTEDLKRISDLLDAEHEGKLLKLPYNLGACGVLYYASEEDQKVYRLTADKMEIYKMMISNKMVYVIGDFEFFLEDFGKIVFESEKEAYKALKEMKEKEN